MAEYTNNHVETEDSPKGTRIDGTSDIHPEDGDNVNVPLMKNGKPHLAHVSHEDPEVLDNSDCPDAGEEDDDPYGDWDDEADWDDDEGEEGSSDRDDEEVAESDSPRDRFSDFAGVSAALLSDALRSALSEESFRELEFGVRSGDTGAYFSIKIRR